MLPNRSWVSVMFHNALRLLFCLRCCCRRRRRHCCYCRMVIFANFCVVPRIQVKMDIKTHLNKEQSNGKWCMPWSVSIYMHICIYMCCYCRCCCCFLYKFLFRFAGGGRLTLCHIEQSKMVQATNNLNWFTMSFAFVAWILLNSKTSTFTRSFIRSFICALSNTHSLTFSKRYTKNRH